MLKNNELRIGNLVNSKNDGIISITNISEKSVAVIEAHCYNHIPVEFISPIPLTEEWLLKFGFEFNEDERVYQKKEIRIELIDEDFIFSYFFGIVYLKYVHQLQNLFFALTGAELTVA